MQTPLLKPYTLNVISTKIKILTISITHPIPITKIKFIPLINTTKQQQMYSNTIPHT